MDKYFAVGNIPGKLILTGTLSALALLLVLICRRPDRLFCLAAMLLSSLGDLLLMRYHPVSDLVSQPLAAGAGCFMAAHVFYMLAYGSVVLARGQKLIGPGLWTACALFVLCLAAFAAGGRAEPKIWLLAVVYLLFICADGAAVLTRCFPRQGQPLLYLAGAVGFLLFLASDLCIGARLLMGNDRFGALIWWLYPAGQCLMILCA